MKRVQNREDEQKSRHPLSEERADTIAKLERLAHLMDTAVGIPGTRIRLGWDSLIGLLPVVGDLLTSAPLAYYLWVAFRFRLGPKLGLQLIANQVVDLLVGSIPLIGDLFDVGFKSNKRNADLLVRALRS